MQAIMAEPDNHRQRLVHCVVRDTKGEQNERYADQQTYDLWRLHLNYKHQLSVERIADCLWLPQTEITRQGPLFTHSGQMTSVARIAFDQFDPGTGIIDNRVRFVPVNQIKTLLPLLSNHFSHDQKTLDVTIALGGVITQHRPQEAFAA